MTTRLINRGEQIAHESELGSFEAECAWSWTAENTRTEPIYLSVRSVRFSDRQATVPKDDKHRIAERMKRELEEAEGLRVELSD